ncbi:hypothetical protein FKP32DRAFT_1138402 [Trametes sanguinea]|nr:hypothetical protein FKP32DRAFT_1138402 [Trametes sanguinea]
MIALSGSLAVPILVPGPGLCSDRSALLPPDRHPLLVLDVFDQPANGGLCRRMRSLGFYVLWLWNASFPPPVALWSLALKTISVCSSSAARLCYIQLSTAARAVTGPRSRSMTWCR